MFYFIDRPEIKFTRMSTATSDDLPEVSLICDFKM